MKIRLKTNPLNRKCLSLPKMSVPINQEIIGQNQKDLDFSQAIVEPRDGPSHGNMY